MSVHIRKVVFDKQGRIIEEYEGTESEVEAYEKKQQKKNEGAQKKKEILLGKSKKTNGLDMEELKRFLAEEIQKLQAIRETHHWYFNNGWWWRPWWYNGSWTYIYSQTQPSFNAVSTDYTIACNAADLSKQIGMNETEISNKVSNTSLLSSTASTLKLGDGLKWATNVAGNNAVYGNSVSNYTCDAKSVDPSIDINLLMKAAGLDTVQ